MTYIRPKYLKHHPPLPGPRPLLYLHSILHSTPALSSSLPKLSPTVPASLPPPTFFSTPFTLTFYFPNFFPPFLYSLPPRARSRRFKLRRVTTRALKMATGVACVNRCLPPAKSVAIQHFARSWIAKPLFDQVGSDISNPGRLESDPSRRRPWRSHSIRRGFHCATSSYSSFNLLLRRGCGVLTMKHVAPTWLNARVKPAGRLRGFR